MAETLGQGRVDGVLAHVAFHPEIVCTCSNVFWQRPPLRLILVGRVPSPKNDLAASPHGLRVGAHHTNGAEVVKHVLGGDGLVANPALGEGNIFGDVSRQVVADHEHVQVLVEGVFGVRPSRVG